MDFKKIIEQGLVDELQILLEAQPDLVNRKILWGDDQQIKTDPLHYVSDSYFNGLLQNDQAGAVAKMLLDFGAEIEGSEGAESPLVGAVSLSASKVAEVLIEAGADVHAISIHGANSLHWAAYVGLPEVAQILLEKGLDIELKCVDFQATPLFWAVQGFSRCHQSDRSDIIDAAAVLVSAGANVNAENYAGRSILSFARELGDEILIQVIERGV